MSQKGIAHLLLIFIAALGIIIFLFFSSSVDFKNRLFSTFFPNKPKSHAEELKKLHEANDIELLNNEFLVKFKTDVVSKVKPSVQDTGIPDLNTLVKKHKINKIDTIFKSKNNQDKLSRWYKLTLDKSPKKIHITQNNKIDAIKEFLQNKDLVDLGKALSDFKASSSIEIVEPNRILKSFRVPNDQLYTNNELWGLKKISAENAWDTSIGTSSAIVAVSDTGIDYNHPDLKDNIWNNPGETGLDAQGKDKKTNGVDDDGNGYIDDWQGWDFTTCEYFDVYGSCIGPKSEDNDPMDNDGHGSHVAGTIGATGNNDTAGAGKSIVGVNWQIQLMPVKGLDKYGSGTEAWLASSITYAADKGAKVINMSWGGAGEVKLISDALEYAYNKGTILVAAAGNSSENSIYFTPGSSSYVITVAASNEFDEVSCFSNFGSKIDIVAPGGDSTWCGGKGRNIVSARSSQAIADFANYNNNSYYTSIAGTSMASPHVAGAVGLIKSIHPEFSAEDIRNILHMSADKVSAMGSDFWNYDFGYGRLNLAKAVTITKVLPDLKISSPNNEPLINGTTLQVTGTVDGRGLPVSWTLSAKGSKSTDAWVNVSQGSSEVSNNTLGIVNLSSFSSSNIYLRLQAHTTNGDNEVWSIFNYDKELATGWPKNYGGSFFGLINFATDPAIADLNGDGKLDIIVAGAFDTKLYAWQADGTNVPGWPATLPDIWNYAPVVSDLDGDGKPEIVVSTWGWTTGNFLSIFKSDGTPYPGWPKATIFPAFNTPALADLDGDGKKEIIYKNCGIDIYKLDGSEFPGWPKRFKDADPSKNTCFEMFNSPSVADLDNDGNPEIITILEPYYYLNAGISDILTNATIYVYHKDGSVAWTANLDSHTTDGSNTSNQSLTSSVADLDGDGKQEVVIQITNMSGCGGSPQYNLGCDKTTVYVFGYNGQIFNGFPKVFNNTLTGSPLVLADVNKDGFMEMIIPGDGKNRVYKLDGQEMTGWNIPVASYYAGPTITDFDNDNKPDILVTGDELNPDLSPDGNQGVFIASENKGIVWARKYGKAEARATSGDFNQDGKLDIVAAMSGDMTHYKFYLWNLPNPTLRKGYSFWPQYGFNANHTSAFTNALYGSDNDADWDDFSDKTEKYLGTSPIRKCSQSSTDSTWPPDFNNTNTINITDFSLFRSHYNTVIGDSSYSQRFDLNTDGKIDDTDFNIFKKYYGKICN